RSRDERLRRRKEDRPKSAAKRRTKELESSTILRGLRSELSTESSFDGPFRGRSLRAYARNKCALMLFLGGLSEFVRRNSPEAFPLFGHRLRRSLPRSESRAGEMVTNNYARQYCGQIRRGPRVYRTARLARRLDSGPL